MKPIERPPTLVSDGQVLASRHHGLAVITLNRPSALNALSLAMIRDLQTLVLAWRTDPTVQAVLIRGAGRPGKPAAFCAGGDIRFFHRAALAGDPALEDFFTEEYALNHLIHRYPKLVVAWMDGICMGGGMGIGQGAGLRVVTEGSRLAMPETQVGLFPDVGGGWFLSRCPGRMGEYLALTGQEIGPDEAIALGLADLSVPSSHLPAILEALCDQPHTRAAEVEATIRAHAQAQAPQAERKGLLADRELVDRHFGQPTLAGIVASLSADRGDFASAALAALRRRSPQMLDVSLAQIRRARTMSLAAELRMERDLVRHCFALRPGAAGETVEGIRALVIDKDHAPRWDPARIEDLDSVATAARFVSPWPAHSHPLRMLERDDDGTRC